MDAVKGGAPFLTAMGESAYCLTKTNVRLFSDTACFMLLCVNISLK